MSNESSQGKIYTLNYYSEVNIINVEIIVESIFCFWIHIYFASHLQCI